MIIAVIFYPCLLQVRNDQRPHSHKIGHDVREFWHAKFAAYNSFLQCWSRSHPIRILSPLQPVHNELRQRVGVHSSKHTRCSSLKAAFEKAQVKQRILNQFLLTSTARKLHLSLHDRKRTAVH